MSTDHRRDFPILTDSRTSTDCPRSVPWSSVAPYEEQAKRNHGGQSLERLAERGGLSPCELMAVVERRSWRSVDRRVAEKWLIEFVRAGEERGSND